MRSVVVVLPASIWALIPMLRYRSMGVLRLTRVSFVAAPKPAAHRYSAPLGAATPSPRCRLAELSSCRDQVAESRGLGVQVAIIERIAVHDQFQALVHRDAQAG